MNKLNKLRALFLASNPQSTTRLALDQEIREITQKIRLSEGRDVLEVISAWAVQPGDLLQYLNQYKPQIVHFSGHGTAAGEIVLVDRTGAAKPVSAGALRALFATLRDNIQLVVLNACYSRVQGAAINEVIDFVIGMNAAIGDQAAIVFAASFYSALGFNRTLRESFEQARTALLLEGIPEEETPELLVRPGASTDRVLASSSPIPLKSVLKSTQRETLPPASAKPLPLPSIPDIDRYIAGLRRTQSRLKFDPSPHERSLTVDEVFVELTCARTHNSWSVVPLTTDSDHDIRPVIHEIRQSLLAYDEEVADRMRDELVVLGMQPEEWPNALAFIASCRGDREKAKRGFDNWDYPSRSVSLAAIARHPAIPTSVDLRAKIEQALREYNLPFHSSPSSDASNQIGRLSERLCLLTDPTPSHILDVLHTVELGDVISDWLRILVIGDPGTGKSTLLQRTLLRALNQYEALPSTASLPIWVELEAFSCEALAAQKSASPVADGDALLDYVLSRIPGHEPRIALKWIAAGQVMILFDGLDEIADDDQRERTSNALADLASRYAAKMVVASRPLGKREDRILRSLREAGFFGVRVRPLNHQQIRAFLTSYFRHLHGDKLPSILAAVTAVESGSDRIAQVPVHLAMLCRIVLSRPDRQLPVGRAALYEECIDRSLTEDILPSLDEELGPGRVDGRKLIDYVIEPWAIERFAANPECPGAPRRGLEHWLSKRLAKAWERSMVPGERDVRITADLLVRRGSLLVRRGDHIEFSHRTFGEYLSACGVWKGKGHMGVLEKRFNDSSWSEIVRLCPSAQLGERLRDGTVGAFDDLKKRVATLSRIAAKSLRVKEYAGLGALARGLLDLRAYGLDMEISPNCMQTFAAVTAPAIPCMRKWVENSGQPGLEGDRLAAAELLGWADDPSLRNGWVSIEAGVFWLGALRTDQDAFDEEQPGGLFALPDEYRIRRWPTTIGEFAPFIIKGGYREARWWSPEGWEARNAGGWTEPAFWPDQAHRSPNTAIVGVSYWEAQAFLNWASEKGHLGLPPDYRLDLPSEAQWEKAMRPATGDPEDLYAWRGSWNSTYANVSGRLGRPTPVGMFPAGHSSRGLWDGVGNVWEWAKEWFDPAAYSHELQDCSAYSAPTYDTFDACGKPTIERCCVIRGAGWHGAKRGSRVSYRGKCGPSVRLNDVGFRAVGKR